MLTVILTGGSSRRMGKDKAALPLAGKTMALYIAERYRELGPVAFSVNRRGRFPAGEYRELVDRYPGCGPMNGLLSAFLETEEGVIFLTAADMPAGEPMAVRYLLERLGQHDACLFAGEPLFGVYRRSCLPAAERCMEEGIYSLRSFLARIDALELPAEGPEFLINLNTPAEYEAFINRQAKS